MRSVPRPSSQRLQQTLLLDYLLSKFLFTCISCLHLDLAAVVVTVGAQDMWGGGGGGCAFKRDGCWRCTVLGLPPLEQRHIINGAMPVSWCPRVEAPMAYHGRHQGLYGHNVLIHVQLITLATCDRVLVG